jgi:mercuric ion transport protein
MSSRSIAEPAATPNARGSSDRCEVRAAEPPRQARGLAWVAGAFVICPCHLPITLAVGAALLGSTAAGVALRAHPIVAGLLITIAWALATWHGFRLMGGARR